MNHVHVPFGRAVAIGACVVATAACGGKQAMDAQGAYVVSGSIIKTARTGQGSLRDCRDGGPDSASACDEVEEELELIEKAGRDLQQSAANAGGGTADAGGAAAGAGAKTK